MLHFWDKFGRPGETKQANLADAADVDEPSRDTPVLWCVGASNGVTVTGYRNLSVTLTVTSRFRHADISARSCDGVCIVQ